MNRRSFGLFLTVAILSLFMAVSGANAQNGTRHEVGIPDILGYQTLVCDFHMHTMFSDGNVWPTVRVEEAWREGYDVMSITDHIEYQPHKKDVPTQHMRPYEIAKPTADALDVLLIRGAEITRSTPPGHHNAIFVNEIDSLDVAEPIDAVRAAVAQGAFVFYNHPGWKHPQGIAEWFPFQQEIDDNGWLGGIEIVNGNDYYPLAHQWCIDKNYTMFGNSDVHQPITFDYDFNNGEHRPATLVFAKKKTEAAVKDAIVNHRTAVWWKGGIIGDEKYLRPLFNESIEILTPECVITGNGSTVLQITNTSEVEYKLTIDNSNEYVSLPASVTLFANRTVRLTVRKKAAPAGQGQTPKEVYGKKRISIPITVTNLYTRPDTGMSDDLTFSVRFDPAPKK